MFVLYLVKTNNGFMAYSIRPTYISTLCLRKKYFFVISLSDVIRFF